MNTQISTKGLSQTLDVVQLQMLQKLLAERLLLEFLVHFGGELHNIRTLGQALYMTSRKCSVSMVDVTSSKVIVPKLLVN